MLSCYEANQHHQPLLCYGRTEACRLATDVVYVSISIILPLILMMVFGLLTIRNVHLVRVRVQEMTVDAAVSQNASVKERQSRRTDRHLLRMLLVQVVFLVILCLPQAIQKIHITVHPFGSGSELDDTIKKFLYNIEVLMAFIASGMPFYIYTLTGGTIFRKTFFDLLHNFRSKLCCCRI
jgi:hypothetical protein